jgi:hypothetical protein
MRMTRGVKPPRAGARLLRVGVAGVPVAGRRVLGVAALERVSGRTAPRNSSTDSDAEPAWPKTNATCGQRSVSEIIIYSPRWRIAARAAVPWSLRSTGAIVSRYTMLSLRSNRT